MIKINEVKYITERQLLLLFNDGSRKIVDFSPFINGRLGEALKEESYFKQFSIESGGGLIWPNGFDFCPTYLFEIGKPVSADIDIAA